MRALILLECIVVLGLAGLVLSRGVPGQGAVEPDVFPASRFLADAEPGERATYRIDQGEGTVDFDVVHADRGGPQGPPKVTITRSFRDQAGIHVPENDPTYEHRLVEHGLFPFLAPAQARAFDRVWVIRRIQRDEIRWLGRPLRCWRVECIDPALEPEQETVVVWFHEAVPVYGILRWERAGHVYECTSWRPAS